MWESKNGQTLKKTFVEKGLDYIIKILLSSLVIMVNTIWGAIQSPTHRIFTLTMNRIFIRAPHMMWKVAVGMMSKEPPA